jgi:hypothetical protein
MRHYMPATVAGNIVEISRGQPTSGGSATWGLGKGLTTPHRKETAYYKILHRASIAGSCEHGNEPSASIKGSEFID